MQYWTVYFNKQKFIIKICVFILYIKKRTLQFALRYSFMWYCTHFHFIYSNAISLRTDWLAEVHVLMCQRV